MDIDPKYDDYDFPYAAAEEHDGHQGFLKELQIAQVHQLRTMLEAEGYTERLDTLTMVRGPRCPATPSPRHLANGSSSGSCGRAGLTWPCLSRCEQDLHVSELG